MKAKKNFSRMPRNNQEPVNNSTDICKSSAVLSVSCEGELDDILLKQDGQSWQIGRWKKGKNIWQGTNAVHTADWMPLGLYDMDGDGHADLPFVRNCQGDSIRVIKIGFYKDGIDLAANWKNIGSFTAKENTDWSIRIGNLTGEKNRNSIIWFSAQYGKLGAWINGSNQWVEIPGSWRNWSMCGCGNFDDSGREKIIMRYELEDRYFAVDLNGELKEIGTLSRDWQLCSVGDFDGSRKEDLLFLHKKSGTLMLWKDGAASKWKKLGQIDTADWIVAGAGRYSGRKEKDLLLRQKSTGTVGYFSGADMSKWHEIGVLAKDWHIIA